MSWKKK